MSEEQDKSLMPFGNREIYILLVDDVPVARYFVDYQRRMQGAPKYYRAEVEYENLFVNDPNSTYLHKGYTHRGLKTLSNHLLSKNIPCLFLSINDDNEVSKHVALKSGYNEAKSSFCLFHPNAVELYAQAIEPVREKISDSKFEGELEAFSNLIDSINMEKYEEKSIKR